MGPAKANRLAFGKKKNTLFVAIFGVFLAYVKKKQYLCTIFV